MVKGLIVGVPLLAVAGLLFPILLTVNLYLDAESKKGWFSVYILRTIKIYGGYASLYGEGIAFHLTKNKAALLPFKDMASAPKKFEITRGFYIAAYSHVLEIGAENYEASVYVAAMLARFCSDVFGLWLYSRKRCQSFKGDVVVRSGQNCFKASMRAVLLFNLAILMLASVKIFLSKILGKISENERKSEQKSE